MMLRWRQSLKSRSRRYRVNVRRIELKNKLRETNKNLYAPWDARKTLITPATWPISYAKEKINEA